MEKRIRKLSIGAEVKEQWHYIVGTDYIIPTLSGKEKRKITDIVDSDSHYELYISNNEVSRHWKDIPKNNITTPEYFID